MMFTPLQPQPSAEDLDADFRSPFDRRGPAALARRAAAAMQEELRAGAIAPGLPTAILFAPEGGKMFGVLVVQEPGGCVGFLRSFSGMLAGGWEVEGFAPPLFDAAARARIEPAGEAVVKAILARATALQNSPELTTLRAAHASLQTRHQAEQAELRARHEENKRRRHARRAELTSAGAPTESALHSALRALDEESRGAKAEQRRLDARQREEQNALASGRLERRLQAHERLRRLVCRTLMKQIHDTYQIGNARGEKRPLRELFAPGEPPAGAADCAAPKLLACAYAHGLRPLGLAEFWWGAPPATGGRISGAFYPACRDKCGPLLPFMLEGLSVPYTEPQNS